MLESKSKRLSNLMKKEAAAPAGGGGGGGSVASLGKIPSPALAVVDRPGDSYALDVPTIPKRKRKKKEDQFKHFQFGKMKKFSKDPEKADAIAGAFGISVK